jgi:hypothetical protein
MWREGQGFESENSENEETGFNRAERQLLRKRK